MRNTTRGISRISLSFSWGVFHQSKALLEILSSQLVQCIFTYSRSQYINLWLGVYQRNNRVLISFSQKRFEVTNCRRIILIFSLLEERQEAQSFSQPLFGLVTQRTLSKTGNRRRCGTDAFHFTQRYLDSREIRYFSVFFLRFLSFLKFLLFSVKK